MQLHLLQMTFYIVTQMLCRTDIQVCAFNIETQKKRVHGKEGRHFWARTSGQLLSEAAIYSYQKCNTVLLFSIVYQLGCTESPLFFLQNKTAIR